MEAGCGGGGGDWRRTQAGGVPLRQENSVTQQGASRGPWGGVTPGAAGGHREALRGMLWECCVCTRVCVHM